MAFVVLCSTMSFTIDMHYCGDTLVETAVFKKAKGCGMEMRIPTSEDCAITKKNCCNDKQLVVDGQDELQLQIDKISFEQHVFIASFVYTYINLFENLDKNVSSYEAYKPPLVIRDIYKIDENYLI
ncbi:hypothetical protein [uncultured Polaribacter sp.]|uniref:HYC_CC_PP family protein n=1 Tax=uncultured Polaribacter sp. TaxID=174711 RepID=UPI00262D51C0|nr:hypothetical protein [uncultured Polaribacter sp.]